MKKRSLIFWLIFCILHSDIEHFVKRDRKVKMTEVSCFLDKQQPAVSRFLWTRCLISPFLSLVKQQKVDCCVFNKTIKVLLFLSLFWEVGWYVLTTIKKNKLTSKLNRWFATKITINDEMIYELRIWNQVKLWSSQLWTQFLKLRKEAWKIQDFNGVWTRDLEIPVRRSNQLSYEATDVGSWSFVGSNVPVRNESMMKWYMKWITYLLRMWNQVKPWCKCTLAGERTKGANVRPSTWGRWRNAKTTYCGKTKISACCSPETKRKISLLFQFSFNVFKLSYNRTLPITWTECLS